jgi:hypothetical protein
MKRFLFVVLLLSGGGALVRAVQPVAVSVRPTILSVGASTRVMVRVDSNEMNRQLVWEVDGDNYYRSSSIQLDGSEAPRSFFFMLHNVPEGEYNVRATIIRNNNSAAVAATTMAVIGMRGLPD